MTQLSVAANQKVKDGVHAMCGVHVQVTPVGAFCMTHERCRQSQREKDERERHQMGLRIFGTAF